MTSSVELLAIACSTLTENLFQCNQVNDYDESDSSEDEAGLLSGVVAAVAGAASQNYKTRHVRMNGFLSYVVPRFTEDVYRGHFRMTRASMMRLVAFCEEKEEDFSWGGDPNPMAMYEMVHIAIWYLANNCVMREMSVLFGRCIASIWRAIDRVTAILERNQEEFVKWPTPEQVPIIADSFARQTGFPGVIGVIDGTLIRIEPPKFEPNAYICRKRWHAINVLGIALPNRSFSYSIVGFPGSMHDARVFSRSDLGRQLNQDPASLIPNSKYHLIGDSGFACKRHLLSSFKRRLANTRGKRRYNRLLNGMRSIVEHTFGDLKNVWRRLFYIKTKLRKAVRIIASCFALHNFLILNEERQPRYANDGPRYPQNRYAELDDDHFSNDTGAEKRAEMIELLTP